MANELSLMGAGRSGSGAPAVPSKILLETGDVVLLETGDSMLKE